MTTPSRSGSVIARPQLAWLPLAALVASVAATLVVAIGAPIGTARVLLAGALVCVGLEVCRRLVGAVRSGRGTPILVAGLAVAVAFVVARIVGELLSPAYEIAALLAQAGLVLLYSGWQDALLASRATPWQRMGDARGAWRRPSTVITLVGVLLLLVAAYLAVRGWMPLRSVHPIRATISAMTLAVLFAAAVTVAIRRYARAREDALTAAAPRHADEVAAHLHDSVLQTLTLIARSSSDPARVAQLARQQERSLRAWLAGRDETRADSLAAALQAVARDVEDEHAGTIVELVAVGDAALDSGASAMVLAAREAMRNAVRHGGSPVRVFAEVDGSVREVFVRDSGPGFALADVVEERRGVRDAIIGRMEHVGGTATIESGPLGTEVALRHDVARIEGTR
jgi:signal transduction histidine kinase